MRANFKRGFCLALDNIARAVSAQKPLKPIRFVHGEPVYRFRVEAIRCGNYLTANGDPFEVTPAALAHWTKTFKAFANRKIAVPVPSGTHFQVDGEHNRGNVIGLTSDGRSLWADVELIGKDAPRIAASNSVSIFAEPSWQDDKGNVYAWPIRHLLLTPDPRIPGLKGFMPIAANNTTIHVPVLRYQAMAVTRKPAKPVRRNALALDGLGSMNENGLGVPGVGDGPMLPVGDDGTGATAGDLGAEAAGKGGTKELKSQVKNHFLDKAHTVLDDDEMEHEDKLECIKELLTECERILEAFADEEEAEPEEKTEHEEGPKGAAMSNLSNLGQRLNCANPATVQVIKLTAKNRASELKNLFLSGQIPGGKPQYDQLVARYVNPERIAHQAVLALANQTDIDADFDATLELFRMNPAQQFGERSGAQHPDWIALTNDYVGNEAAEKQAAEDAENFARPSSQRVSKK